MWTKQIKRPLMILATLFGSAAPVLGQGPIGVRAAGMGGAFVAVADDATAVYWNPAGLATGAFANIVFELGIQKSHAASTALDQSGNRLTAGMISVSMPPLGLTYYRVGEYAVSPQEAAVKDPLGRQEVRRTVRALVTSNVGATVLQSITDYVVVGATVKLVRGESGLGSVGGIGADEAFGQAARLPRRGETTGDVDLGVMAEAGRMRAGIVAWNLTTPTFDVGDEGGELQLERQVRAGVGWGSGWPGNSRVVVDIDGDLTRRQSIDGDRRDVAVGVETWWLNRRLGIRGGLRGSTLGDSRAVAATGLSAGIARGIFLEVQAATGAADQRAWSVGGRVTY